MMVKEEYGGQHLIASEQDKEGNFQHSLPVKLPGILLNTAELHGKVPYSGSPENTSCSDCLNKGEQIAE